MSPKLYHYKAKVVDVYDGDTITVDIDLGMGMWRKCVDVRLHGINAPEVRGSEKEAGKKSRDWLERSLLDREIVLQTHRDKRGKYGRLIGTIWFDWSQIDPREDPGTWVDVNQKMVEEGLAEVKHYD